MILKASRPRTTRAATAHPNPGPALLASTIGDFLSALTLRSSRLTVA
jgi:hypothetical protein